MNPARLILAFFITVTLATILAFAADAPKPAPPPAACATATSLDDFFTNEVWPKVAAHRCFECHKAGGDADESEFVLLDPARASTAEQPGIFRQNREQFAAMAKSREGDQSRLLLKPLGQLKHGGKVQLKSDSAAYATLAEFVRRVTAPSSAQSLARATERAGKLPPFFDGIVMLDDRALLRRVTLSLAGRLPTDGEITAVTSGGLKAMPAILDAIMTEDAFYARLREAFNDIFLTVGLDGSTEADVFSYEHFDKTRLWDQKFDLTAAGDAKAQQQARYKLTADYRKAILGEPMKLVEHIVRNGHPFTEIVTADYIMVSPYTARGYGIYEQVKSQFKNPDDPFEYIPVKIKALTGRSKDTNQDSATGFYPHAGLLSTFQYLARYPTTETNRNRARARVYYQQFLGVDVLDLAARVQDAAAVTAKYKMPTMEASECVVCHKTLDPVAGCFQDYWRFADEGIYGKRKGGWFTDMFVPGFEGENLPANERWRSLQWLGERTAKDPRFAIAMVEHAWYVLSGREALLPPKDADDPLFPARLRAYREQRTLIESIASRFARENYNFKSVIKDLVLSSFYRADGVASAVASPQRRAELDDLGLSRMLAPEQLERKVAAIFGKPWGKLNETETAMLYGGIDSKEVTERAADPSGAMGAIQRILANDVALKNTALDFSRPAADRIFFKDVEPTTLPGASPEADAKIRATIVHLHDRILGRQESTDSAEVTRTYNLFAGIVKDANDRKGFEKQEIWSGREKLLSPVPDPKYAVRAWRGVLTYLMRRPEFLYE